jgi:hypothetical protein
MMRIHTHGAIRNNLLINIVRALSLGISYGIIETYVPIEQIPIYRVIYLAMLSLPFISVNYFVWLGDAALCMLVQDMTYWAYLHEIPGQWAWYYPVYHGIPLLYPAGIVLITIFYWRARKFSVEIKFK